MEALKTQTDPRHPREAPMKGQSKPSSVSLPRPGATWQGLGWGEGPEGVKVSVPGNLPFPLEEAAVSIPRLLHAQSART